MPWNNLPHASKIIIIQIFFITPMLKCPQMQMNNWTDDTIIYIKF